MTAGNHANCNNHHQETGKHSTPTDNPTNKILQLITMKKALGKSGLLHCMIIDRGNYDLSKTNSHCSDRKKKTVLVENVMEH